MTSSPITKEIFLKISAIENTKQALNKITTNTEMVKNRFNALNKVAKKTNVNMDRLRGIFQQQNIGFNKSGKMIDTVTGRMVNYGEVTNRVRRSTQRFRMELLSVMFFGMAIQQMFMGLLQPAMQTAGVFDIWSMILTILFLPVALKITQSLIKLLDVVSGLSPETKELIGNIVMIGLAFGTALLVFGQVGLGINGVKMAFSFLFTPIGVVLVLIGLIIGAFLLLKGISSNLGETVRNVWEQIKVFVSTAIDEVITTINGLINSFLEIDWNGVWKSMFGFIDKIAVFLKQMFDKIKEWFVSVDWAVVWEKFVSFSTSFIGHLLSFLKKTINYIFKWAAGADWIKIWGNLFEWSGKIIGFVATFFGKLIRTIIELDWGSIAISILKILGSYIYAFFTRLPELLVKGVGGFVSGLTAPLTTYDDFIFRAGQAPIAVSPNDNIMGFKGDSPAGGTTVNNYINIDAKIASGVDINELSRKIGDEVIRSVNSQMRR